VYSRGGGAAHLAGVVAAQTVAPVLGCVESQSLKGLDSLLAMVQMPGDSGWGRALGKAGATMRRCWRWRYCEFEGRG